MLADHAAGGVHEATVMSYLDNLIAWGDNLFSTRIARGAERGDAVYVIASRDPGPDAHGSAPPPEHADESFDQLEPSLDAFANAMVEIENVIGGAGGSGGSGIDGGGGGIAPGADLLFQNPAESDKLLGYWGTVADRLYKLRHCQNIAGRAAATGAVRCADRSRPADCRAGRRRRSLERAQRSVGAPLPNYRFTSLYPQALDFVNAVRAYGASLAGRAREDRCRRAGSAAADHAATASQRRRATFSDWQVQQAQSDIDALNQTLALAQQKHDFNDNTGRPMNLGNRRGGRHATRPLHAAIKTIAAAMRHGRRP